MKSIDVVIQGKEDLLIHKYTASSISTPIVRKTGTNDASNFNDEWAKNTYVDNKDYVYMPAVNISSCLFEGAKGLKIGKVALTRRIYTSIAISPNVCHILVEDKLITLDDIRSNGWILTTGAVVQGRRIDRHRTKLPFGWKIVFTIVCLPGNQLNEQTIRQIVENAGNFAGLGDWRPSSPKKPGPYGTFDIIGWQVNE